MQLAQIFRRNPAAQFVGGESMDEFADRVLGAVHDIGGLHPNQRVLVVTHGWVLDILNRYVAGLPRHAVLAEKPKNGESVWVWFDDQGIGGNSIGARNHLAEPANGSRVFKC